MEKCLVGPGERGSWQASHWVIKTLHVLHWDSRKLGIPNLFVFTATMTEKERQKKNKNLHLFAEQGNTELHLMFVWDSVSL